MNHIWRFFCDHSELYEGARFLLNESEHHYAFHVLRLGVNESIELTDGEGRIGKAKVFAINKSRAEVEVEKVLNVPPTLYKIIVNLAMPKPSTLDDLVPVLSELGVHELNIILTERAPTKAVPQIDKLKKQARNALRINKQAWASSISVFRSIDEFLKTDLSRSENFLCDESPLHENSKPHLHLAAWLEKTTNKNISVFIGPEASFSEAERQRILNTGVFKSVSLGSAILRVPTAATMAASITLGHFQRN